VEYFVQDERDATTRNAYTSLYVVEYEEYKQKYDKYENVGKWRV